jgi:hypothetical protein
LVHLKPKFFALLIVIARSGSYWFVTPKALPRFTVPVKIDESRSRSNHQRYKPARGFVCRGAMDAGSITDSTVSYLSAVDDAVNVTRNAAWLRKGIGPTVRHVVIAIVFALVRRVIAKARIELGCFVRTLKLGDDFFRIDSCQRR